MTYFQENAWTEGRMEGQEDRQTLFHRNLTATVGGPKISEMSFLQSKSTEVNMQQVPNHSTLPEIIVIIF